jgi:hypothetical protein
VKKLIVMCAMVMPVFAQAAWTDATGKPIPDTENMRSAGDFGVSLLLTPDEKQFRHSWSTSTTPPKLVITSTVKRGGVVTAVLVFQGCSPNAAGACDVVCEFELVNPDGTKMLGGSGQVTTAANLPTRGLQLGQTSMTVQFDNTDPEGEYKAIAVVKDRVSGRALTVVGKLKLTL